MEELRKLGDSVDEMDASVSRSQQLSQNSDGSSASNGTLNGSLFSKAAMSQRIVSVEYYMSPPVKEFDNLHSEFRNSSVKKVPVIRIFGTTPAGQKMCANIHGVYPYISILDDETVEGFEYRIASALDNAINDSVATNFAKGGNSYKSAAQHVFKVIRIVGKTFYGYRSNSEVFLRIFFYNPSILKKAVDLLQSGSVLGRRFQPYEAHIPFSLQFMIDYCLYGMNYIHYAAVKFRRNSRENVVKHSEDINCLSQGSNSSILGYIDPDCIQESLLGPGQLSKLTLCELEADVLASDIILESTTSNNARSVNPGILAIWRDEQERRRLKGEENFSQITIPESQERSQVELLHPAEEHFMQILCGKLTSFFENSTLNGSNIVGSQNMSVFNNSCMEDADVVPSSQVLNHFSGDETSNNGVVIDNQLSQEEDDFLKLLEEMAREPESVNETEISEAPFGNGIEDNEEMDESPESDINAEEDLWSDSLLSSSMLEKISDAELSLQDSETRGSDKSSEGSSKMIFQCDGQAGDSDSNSDDCTSRANAKEENKKVANTRLSRRMSEIKFKLKDAGAGTISTSKAKPVDPESKQTKRRPGRPSTASFKSSPVVENRLSLTFRRKSRSQDSFQPPHGTPTNLATPCPVKSKRRSRSLSTAQTDSEHSSKQRQTSRSAKVNVEKEVEPSVSKPVTRKSLSVPSSSNHTAKPKVGDIKVTASQDKILKEQPVVRIRKLDSVNMQSTNSTSKSTTGHSKRVRRKPQRFLDGDNESPHSANSNENNTLETSGNASEDILEQTKIEPTTQVPRRKVGRPKKKKVSNESNHEKVSENSGEKETSNEESKDGCGGLEGGMSKRKGKLKGIVAVTRSDSIQQQHQTQEKEDDTSSCKQSSTTVPKKDQNSCVGNDVGVTDSLEGLSNDGNEKQSVKGRMTKLNKNGIKVKQLGIIVRAKTAKSIQSSTNSDSGLGDDKQQNQNVLEDRELKRSKVVEKEQVSSSPVPVSESLSAAITSSLSSKQTAEEENETESRVTVNTEARDGNSDNNTQIPKKKKKRLGLGISRSTSNGQSPMAYPTRQFVPVGKKKEKEKPSGNVPEDTTTTLDAGCKFPPESHETEMEASSEIATDKKKEYSDVGTTCKPDSKSTMSQTNSKPITKDASATAQPDMKETGSGSQVLLLTSSETQTYQREMVTVGTQTDVVAPLCLCQCSCIIKEKADASIDNQDDLKPAMENKKIQVDNVDMITRARSSRFTTPQGNKIRRTTPSKSPEKRKHFQESPGRRQMMNTTPTPSSSRYLSALVLKTPTSHHKYKAYGRGSPSTPTYDSTSDQGLPNATPPGSREEYLINSIRASASPRKRLSSFRPRNLDVETKHELFQNARTEAVSSVDAPAACETDNPSKLETDNPSERETDIPPGSSLLPSIEYEMQVVMEAGENEDLSVNSIYEYEEEPSPQVKATTPTLPSSGENEESPASLTPFQKKRILSKHRTKHRLEKKKAAALDANRGIPDIFEYEYEPLKQPASYKSTLKWVEAEKSRNFASKDGPIEEKKHTKMLLDGESSDEESLPPPVKLFGGGNMSDDDEDSDSEGHASSGIMRADGHNVIKPFTPPMFNLSTPSSQVTPGERCYYSGSGTPRSILRQGGTSRRLTGNILKRKIRWEDNEPCKRIKIETDGILVKTEDDDASQTSILTNGSLNKTVDTSELDGPALKNAAGFENSMSNLHDAKALHQCQFLTTMCVEVHCASRNELLPDPAIDPILAIFVLISNDYPEGFKKPKESIHLLLLDDKSDIRLTTENEFSLSQSTKAYTSEENLIDAFVKLVRLWDPDIFVGYEVEKSSFGYLIQRALYFEKDLTQELSRVLPIVKKNGEKETPYRQQGEWNGTIGGRIVLNLWRLLRHEITVQSYTFENAAYHILLRRVCKFSQKMLSAYWSNKMHRYKVIQYYTVRIKGAMQIMEKLDLINRTSELARLFGIQFYEVLSRGSQFRVESMMLRATKPLDLIAPSPNSVQRAKMRAPEYLPLILEPISNYYTDPVAVLDFQSLYPSMMIAYNYDYASLLGRVEHLGEMEHFPLGCLEHAVSPADLLRLKDDIHVSPAGVAFLNKSVVKGVLPEMLEQILETRQMVKRSMKKYKNDGPTLQKVLDSRQLGLKLIANVTYGYTSANFSGRMPCVEIADSIVSKGRETLQRAIDLVKENYDRWGAQVVYGDTDSMFILFRGKSRDEAFKLAYEIADEVTKVNPKPVKLKFEKIYQPCILQSKKRYVGYAYETPDQIKPTYDAKGIETVRRDGCPAVKKILEKTLHVLFTYNSRQRVEEYVKAQFTKLFKGRVSMQDYIFAREYRGRQGYKPTASVPSLELAKKFMEIDPRAEPLVSERVPYIVIYGDPKLPLIKLVRTPNEYLKNPAIRLNAHYYIEKAIIPALNRCLSHAGMNVAKWYLQLPRKYLRSVLDQKSRGQGTLDGYILHQNCLRCDGKAEDGLCNNCLKTETESVIYLQEVLRNAKSKLNACIEICTSCAGETDRCVSIDCPILHKLTRYQRDQAYMKNVERQLVKLEW